MEEPALPDHPVPRDPRLPDREPHRRSDARPRHGARLGVGIAAPVANDTAMHSFRRLIPASLRRRPRFPLLGRIGAVVA